jgi:hypothetical protein
VEKTTTTVASSPAEKPAPADKSAEPEKKKGFFRRLLPF